MIQELLCGVVEAERKISTISSPSQSVTSSPTSSPSEPQQQNLRCPRCDSPNTKFCYYNNYNLTQPRHFCKTCRRYWTKGGALRNVPIGGGCRKTKSVIPSIASGAVGGKSMSNKVNRPMTSLASINDVMGRTAGLAGGLDHSPELLPSSPILWSSMPHSSHLLALLRASQMQNVNPNSNSSLLNSIRIKEAQMVAESNCGVNGFHNLNLDHVGQYYHDQHAQQQNLLLNDMPTSSGIQELYQRLRSSSSTSSYPNGNDNLQVIAHNVGSGTHCSSSVANTTTTTTSIFEPIPINAGDIGYWNPPMVWSDLSAATNGAFP